MERIEHQDLQIIKAQINNLGYCVGDICKRIENLEQHVFSQKARVLDSTNSGIKNRIKKEDIIHLDSQPQEQGGDDLM